MRSLKLRYLMAMTVLALATGNVIAQTRAPRGFTEIDISTRIESPDNSTPEWRDHRIELLHQYAPRTLALGRLGRAERFGTSDNYMALAGYLPFGERTTAFAEWVTSPEHRFLARDSLQLQLHRSLPAGWGIEGGMRTMRFNTAKVDVYNLAVEKYFASWRTAVTVLPSHSDAAGNATSYRWQLGYYYGDRNNFQLVIADGREVDKPAALGVILATRVSTVEIYGRHWISPNWAINYGAGETRQGNVSRRNLSAGLHYRF